MMTRKLNSFYTYFMAGESNIPIEKLATAGPGLVFLVYPQAMPYKEF